MKMYDLFRIQGLYDGPDRPMNGRSETDTQEEMESCLRGMFFSFILHACISREVVGPERITINPIPLAAAAVVQTLFFILPVRGRSVRVLLFLFLVG